MNSCASLGKDASTSQSTSAVCAVSRLQPGPVDFNSGRGLARAGPLWFSAFGDSKPGSPARLDMGGGLYNGSKVVIHPDAQAKGVLRLTGIQCGSGIAVKFCYQKSGCTWETRLNASVLTLLVDLGLKSDYHGYMLFPGPGAMKLTVANETGTLGSTTIEIPDLPEARQRIDTKETKSRLG